MKNNIWNRMSGWLRAFLLVALIFLALGLGTLGSVASVGDGFVLPVRKSTDSKDPCIILNLVEPGHGEEDHVHRDLYIREIYFNLGAVYCDPEGSVTVGIARGTTSASTFYNKINLTFGNLLHKNTEEGPDEVIEGAVNRWAKYTVPASDVSRWRLSDNAFIKLTAIDANVLINEIVFVANEEDGSGEPVALTSYVHSASELLPAEGETKDELLKRAAAIVDSTAIPNLTQSGFFALGDEEIVSMTTVAEMRLGSTYTYGNLYRFDKEGGTYYLTDTVYGSLGNALLALGTYIGGMSPFGLRLMPFLASFGVLVFGFLFVRKLTGSEKAGFIFSLIFALSGVSMSLGHFGVPLMIGLFFLMGALYFALRFFKDGMKRADFRSAVPALLAGLFGAAAICVNGAFAIPAVGVVALFVAGAVREARATRAALDAAIDEVEASEKEPAPENAETVSEPRRRLAAALRDRRVKTALPSALFGVALIVGAYLISMLALLPMYHVYLRLYDDPVSPAKNIFYFLWKSFAGGFAGSNYLTVQSAFAPFYVLYRSAAAGGTTAVTAAGPLIAVAALFAGLLGAALAIARLIRHIDAENFREELLMTLIPLVMLVLGLVTAAFCEGGVAFLMLAFLALFMLAAKSASDEEEGRYGLAVKVLSYVCLGLLVAVFGLFAAYIFSIPVSGGPLLAMLGGLL